MRSPAFDSSRPLSWRYQMTGFSGIFGVLFLLAAAVFIAVLQATHTEVTENGLRLRDGRPEDVPEMAPHHEQVSGNPSPALF
jgi:hypothetical protein